MKSLIIVALLCFIALANAAFSITYTTYFDSACKDVDSTYSGSVEEGVCSPKTRRYLQTGKITSIQAQSLVSCDYEDKNCQRQRGSCRTYSNAQCSPSADNTYSELFVWAANANTPGGWDVNYTSFTDGTCGKVQLTGPLIVGNCDREFPAESLPQKITFVNDEYLNSTDYKYSDWNCSGAAEPANPKYVRDLCYVYGELDSFSCKYSWTRISDDTATATSIPTTSSQSTAQTTGSQPGSTTAQTSGSEPGSTGSQSTGAVTGSETTAQTTGSVTSQTSAQTSGSETSSQTSSQSTGSSQTSSQTSSQSTGSETGSTTQSSGASTSAPTATGTNSGTSTPAPSSSTSDSGASPSPSTPSPTDEPASSASSIFLSLSAVVVVALAML